MLISIPGHLLGVPDFYYMAFIPQFVFTLRMVPQIWRIISNFFITGPKLGIILDPYFLFTYCSSLETTAARFSQPGDFFVYLVFSAIIIVVRPGSPTNGPSFMRPSMHRSQPAFFAYFGSQGGVRQLRSWPSSFHPPPFPFVHHFEPRLSARPVHSSCHGS